MADYADGGAGLRVSMLPDVVMKNSPLISQVSTLAVDFPIDPFELGFACNKAFLSNR